MMPDRDFSDVRTLAPLEAQSRTCVWPSFCSTADKRTPHPKRKTPEPDETDAVLARDLASLSMQERVHILEDIHGVASVPHEDPEFVENCLVQMENEINQLKRKDFYSKALFLAPSRVKDAAFRLMFLRATDFDPSRAAKMIVTVSVSAL